MAKRVGVRWFCKRSGADICFHCVDETGKVLREEQEEEEEEEVRVRVKVRARVKVRTRNRRKRLGLG